MKTYNLKSIHLKINSRGQDEQESAYLFPGLYSGKALTRNEAGQWKALENKLKRKYGNKAPGQLRIF